MLLVNIQREVLLQQLLTREWVVDFILEIVEFVCYQEKQIG